jgi:hypothetical protein
MCARRAADMPTSGCTRFGAQCGRTETRERRHEIDAARVGDSAARAAASAASATRPRPLARHWIAAPAVNHRTLMRVCRRTARVADERPSAGQPSDFEMASFRCAPGKQPVRYVFALFPVAEVRSSIDRRGAACWCRRCR